MSVEIVLMYKIMKIKWLNLGTPFLVTQFVSHIFGHAFVTFWLLEIPYGWIFAWLVAGYAVYKEMITDGHGWKVFSDLDGRTDLLSRMFGSLIPYLVLAWR